MRPNCSEFGQGDDCSSSGCCADGLECYQKTEGENYRECHPYGECPDTFYCPESCPSSIHEECQGEGKNCSCREGLECVALSDDYSQCQLPEIGNGSCTLDLYDICGSGSSGCCRQGTECLQESESYAHCRMIGDCPNGWACGEEERCLKGFYELCDDGCCVDGLECASDVDVNMQGHVPGGNRCLPAEGSSTACALAPGAACGFGLGCCAAGLECAVKDAYPQCYPAGGCAEPLAEFETCELNGHALGCCSEGHECHVVDEMGTCRDVAAEGSEEGNEVGADEETEACTLGSYAKCTDDVPGCCGESWDGPTRCCHESAWWAMCVPYSHHVPGGYVCDEPTAMAGGDSGGEDDGAAEEEEEKLEIPLRCGGGRVLANGGFEDTSPGVPGWDVLSSVSGVSWAMSDLDLEGLAVVVDPQRAGEGNTYLLVHDREAQQQVPGQWVDATCFEAGRQYEVSARFRLPSGAPCFRGEGGCPEAVLRVDGNQYVLLAQLQGGTDGAWNLLQGTFSLTDEQLLAGNFFVSFDVPGAAEFALDAVAFGVPGPADAAASTSSSSAPAAPTTTAAAEAPLSSTPSPSPFGPAPLSCDVGAGGECTAGQGLGCCGAGLMCAATAVGWSECVADDAECPAGWSCPWNCPASQRGFVNPSLEDSQLPAGWAHDGGNLVVAMHGAPDGQHSLMLKDRSAGWNGVGQSLSTSCFTAGVYYEITAMVKLPWEAKCFRDGWEDAIPDHEDCPEVVFAWGPADDRKWSLLGGVEVGARGEWNPMHIAFKFTEEELAGSDLFVKFQVTEVIDFELDNVVLRPAPEGAQTLEHGADCHGTFLGCLPELRCMQQDSTTAECRSECPQGWACNASLGLGSAPDEEPAAVHAAVCNLTEWSDCHDFVAGCCEAGLLCYRESPWYSQCRKPGECPDGWDCSITSLDNPPPPNNAAFGWLRQLSSLKLNSNNLTGIGSGAFGGLSQLQRLELQHNDIADVSPEAFDSLWRVTHLELSDNLIAGLDWQTLHHLLSVEYLGLFYNPLNCLPLFPSSVRFQGVSFEQASSLSGCLPRSCPTHVGELVPGWSTPTWDGKNPLLVEGIRAVEQMMLLFRADVRRDVDAWNLAAGLYVDRGGGKRCWCMGAEECWNVNVGHVGLASYVGTQPGDGAQPDPDSPGSYSGAENLDPIAQDSRNDDPGSPTVLVGSGVPVAFGLVGLAVWRWRASGDRPAEVKASVVSRFVRRKRANQRGSCEMTCTSGEHLLSSAQRAAHPEENQMVSAVLCMDDGHQNESITKVTDWLEHGNVTPPPTRR